MQTLWYDRWDCLIRWWIPWENHPIVVWVRPLFACRSGNWNQSTVSVVVRKKRGKVLIGRSSSTTLCRFECMHLVSWDCSIHIPRFPWDCILPVIFDWLCSSLICAHHAWWGCAVWHAFGNDMENNWGNRDRSNHNIHTRCVSMDPIRPRELVCCRHGSHVLPHFFHEPRIGSKWHCNLDNEGIRWKLASGVYPFSAISEWVHRPNSSRACKWFSSTGCKLRRWSDIFPWDQILPPLWTVVGTRCIPHVTIWLPIGNKPTVWLGNQIGNFPLHYVVPFFKVLFSRWGHPFWIVITVHWNGSHVQLIGWDVEETREKSLSLFRESKQFGKWGKGHLKETHRVFEHNVGYAHG